MWQRLPLTDPSPCSLAHLAFDCKMTFVCSLSMFLNLMGKDSHAAVQCWSPKILMYTWQTDATSSLVNEARAVVNDRSHA